MAIKRSQAKWQKKVQIKHIAHPKYIYIDHKMNEAITPILSTINHKKWRKRNWNVFIYDFQFSRRAPTTDPMTCRPYIFLSKTVKIEIFSLTTDENEFKLRFSTANDKKKKRWDSLKKLKRKFNEKMPS